MINPPRNLPDKAGVYIFKRGQTPLYIGKAGNIKKRLSSYWRKNISDKIRMMLAETSGLEWIPAESEVDALIKESELIKRHYPKYNVLLRDDKNHFYVGITRPNFLKKTSGGQAKEGFPKIFLTHQPNLRHRKSADYIGPFTSGTALKSTLRLLRGIFPYCTCKEVHKRPCLNSEIGRCPGYCCFKPGQPYSNVLENIGIVGARNEYKTNIQGIVAVLNGRKKKILRELEKEMKVSAKKQEFEKAARIRNQIRGLGNIFAHAVLNNNHEIRRPLNWQKIKQNLKTILGASIHRAEGYDISNISGTEATGSMVVFIDGRPAKSEYRKFKIKTVKGANDIAMHAEVIRRRLSHSEWKYPDLMLIDGGKAQLNAALNVISRVRPSRGGSDPTIPTIAALAKREEELYIGGRKKPLPLASLPPDTAFFFQKIRDESHRFAKKYHHKRREILFRE